jgi:hypothetical protein
MNATGVRFRLAPPGALLNGKAGPGPPVAMSPDLANAGVRLKPIGLSFEIEQGFILVRERASLLSWLSAGDEDLDTSRLTCVLLTEDGDEIGQGVIEPNMRIDAGTRVSVELVHPRLADAARVEIRKLP